MQNFKNQVIEIESGQYTDKQLVSLLVLITQKLDIDTISEMARKTNKTPRGIKISNKFKKIKIGKQLMAINGVKEDKFPF